MEIIELRAENYQRLRVVTIRPDGRPVVMLTGKNGQGKTSVLDSIMFALKGTEVFTKNHKDRKTIIRNGAESMLCRLKMRDGSNQEVTVTRRMGQAGNQPALTIEANGRETTPQKFLDNMLGALTFDPLDFIGMEPEQQVSELKKLSHVTVDFAALDAANEEDYKERVLIGREIKTLEGQLAGMTVITPLPKAKIDEAAIFEKLNKAAETNARAQELNREKQQLGTQAALLVVDMTKKESELEFIEAEIKKLQTQAAARRAEIKNLEAEQKKAEKAFRLAPAGELVDTVALTDELQSAQRTNRAIDTRDRFDSIKADLTRKEIAYQKLSDQMSAREARKTEAVAKAKIPVPGLTFDSTTVKYNGTAIGNLSGGEQLRVATLIGMASNPKLRVICIRNGESLDEDGLAAIAALAEEHKFQVWMARVDSSGKCGIVMEDGMVIADNDKEGK